MADKRSQREQKDRLRGSSGQAADVLVKVTASEKKAHASIADANNTLNAAIRALQWKICPPAAR